MSKKASSITNKDSDFSASNGSKKKLSRSICNSLPLSSFHHQFLESGCITSVPGPTRKSSNGEGFRTPAPCRTVVQVAGAGVRKPPKEETAGRKGLMMWDGVEVPLQVGIDYIGVSSILRTETVICDTGDFGNTEAFSCAIPAFSCPFLGQRRKDLFSLKFVKRYIRFGAQRADEKFFQDVELLGHQFTPEGFAACS